MSTKRKYNNQAQYKSFKRQSDIRNHSYMVATQDESSSSSNAELSSSTPVPKIPEDPIEFMVWQTEFGNFLGEKGNNILLGIEPEPDMFPLRIQTDQQGQPQLDQDGEVIKYRATFADYVRPNGLPDYKTLDKLELKYKEDKEQYDKLKRFCWNSLWKATKEANKLQVIHEALPTRDLLLAYQRLEEHYIGMTDDQKLLRIENSLQSKIMFLKKVKFPSTQDLRELAYIIDKHDTLLTQIPPIGSNSLTNIRKISLLQSNLHPIQREKIFAMKRIHDDITYNELISKLISEMETVHQIDAHYDSLRQQYSANQKGEHTLNTFQPRFQYKKGGGKGKGQKSDAGKLYKHQQGKGQRSEKSRDDDERIKGNCWYCNIPGHRESDCRKKKAEESGRPWRSRNSTSSNDKASVSSTLTSTETFSQNSPTQWAGWTPMGPPFFYPTTTAPQQSQISQGNYPSPTFAPPPPPTPAPPSSFARNPENVQQHTGPFSNSSVANSQNVANSLAAHGRNFHRNS